jgi:hypothetical protein
LAPLSLISPEHALHIGALIFYKSAFFGLGIIEDALLHAHEIPYASVVILPQFPDNAETSHVTIVIACAIFCTNAYIRRSHIYSSLFRQLTATNRITKIKIK